MKNYIWLFGENLSTTANNNSYFFWDHVVSLDDGIDKYFILEKNAENSIFVSSLDEHRRNHIIWRNSLKHFELYCKADMFFVTLSYRDVRPEFFFNKSYNFLTVTPTIYLQHGITAIKRLGYTGKDYNNNILRFVYYNPLIKNQLININHFRDYQLFNGIFMPRYKEFVKRAKSSKNNNKNTILWFITWREYLGKNFATKKLLFVLKKIFSNISLQKFLSENDITLRLCLHSFFNKEIVQNLLENVHIPNIEWVHASNTDIMSELASSKLLITDYSSVGFDFTFLNRPVILFTPDLEEYSRKRKFYCETEELLQYAITSPETLIECITSGKYEVNPFFKMRLPDDIDYAYVQAGKHIDRMYLYFKQLQEHRITFLGYNFYGKGGTVSATYALAEALLEKGFLVSLLSLKQNRKPKNVPYGLNMKALYNANSNQKSEKIKKVLFKKEKYFKYLLNDRDKKNLIPYSGYALQKWLNEEGSETILSTRESLHGFLSDASSDRIKNKLYFYHCSALVFDEVFPNLASKLKDLRLDKAIFVTENSRELLVDHLGYTPYSQYLILGNTLCSGQTVSKDDIIPVEEKDRYSGVYLLRINSERREDINTLIEYGKYLKTHNFTNIRIYVYGAGNYVDTFLNLLIENEVTDFIKYCGSTDNPKDALKKYDAVVDFSTNQSFGMTYIEAIFNGKMVFCKRNSGSLEIFQDIPEVFYESFEELTNKILNLPNMDIEQLKAYYDLLSLRYSRSVLSTKLLSYIDA